MGARTIVITGFMGAGKTAAAEALARRLACMMIDLDRLVEARQGRTARAIIEGDGEPAFREAETLALLDALEGANERVVALGGGTWTLERNRALVKEHGGLTVWLDAPFELCWKRIEVENGLQRPLARDSVSARRLYDARRQFYDQASLRIEVSEGKSPDEIAAEIEGALPEVKTR